MPETGCGWVDRALGGRTYERARAVVEAAEQNPRYQSFVDDMDRTGRVNGVYRRLKVAKQADVLKSKALPLPTGPFDVLVLDPPWQYQIRAADPSHRSLPYPSMALEEIAALDIPELAAENAVCWLWVPNSFVHEALHLIEGWGFTYKTTLTWAKQKFGTGEWLRGQTEHCILATRGRPIVTLTNQSTLLTAAARDHSRKPDEFFQLVESLFPGSKVELFARKPRVGWISWGDEVGVA